jgi:anti-anti-sigma regulatory factor
MIRAKAEKSRELLKVCYSGHVTAEETQKAAREVVDLVKDLAPGFCLVVDLTDLETMDLNCVPHLSRMMDVCNEAGVSLIVRVIPDPHKDIGMKIMSLFHYGKRVRIVTTQTCEEALAVIAAGK